MSEEEKCEEESLRSRQLYGTVKKKTDGSKKKSSKGTKKKRRVRREREREQCHSNFYFCCTGPKLTGEFQEKRRKELLMESEIVKTGGTTPHERGRDASNLLKR